MKNLSFWKADWFLGAAVALLLLIASGSDLIQSLERKAYDLGVKADANPGVDNVAYARRMRDMFDGDPFPFGIEKNRKALEAITQFAFDQRMVPRKYTVEELFTPVN